MGRNYEKEAEWAKNKYEHFYISIDKELGKAFKEKAKQKGKPVNVIFREMVENYMNE